MWGWLLAVVGLTLAAKGRPKTSLNKLAVLGPRSGETWDAELFPDAGLVVVHSRRDQTVAAFTKVVPTPAPGAPRYAYKQGKGSATIIAMMREDFEGATPPL